MKTFPFSKSERFRSSPSSGSGLRLGLIEHEFHKVVGKIEERIVHHGDRPEIEARILAFVNQALGPSTEGVAAAMGISAPAAAVHLRGLSEANRIWGQPAHGNEMAWHISNEGRRYLAEKGWQQILAAH